MLLLVVEGIVIGFLLGLTGAGGGILAVPALMTSQGWTVAQAAPIGLLAVALSTLIGTIEGLLKKIVRYRAAIWIAIIGTPMAHIGILISNTISPVWLMLMFSLVMFTVGYRLISNRVSDFHNPPCQVNPSTGRFIWNFKTGGVLAGIGIIAGLLTGMLGVGGGFVIVPALRKVTNLDMHSIVATSLMIIFLISGISIVMHIAEGFHYPVAITSTFALACVAGMLLGRRVIRFIPPAIVQKVFALMVFAVAIYMVIKIVNLTNI